MKEIKIYAFYTYFLFYTRQYRTQAAHTRAIINVQNFVEKRKMSVLNSTRTHTYEYVGYLCSMYVKWRYC